MCRGWVSAEEMEKLKQIISENQRWQPLSDYINRIEGFRETDFPLCVENAKSLLESIAKEICTSRGQDFLVDDSTSKLLKLAFGSLGYHNREAVQKIGGAIAGIGHQMSSLRNALGDTAHGRPLNELQRRKTAIERASSDFLLHSTELVSCFLIQMFEANESAPTETESVVYYEDNVEFNDSWDEQYGEFTMGEYSFWASQILFTLDPLAYRNEIQAYKGSLKEVNGQ